MEHSQNELKLEPNSGPSILHPLSSFLCGTMLEDTNSLTSKYYLNDVLQPLNLSQNLFSFSMFCCVKNQGKHSNSNENDKRLTPTWCPVM